MNCYIFVKFLLTTALLRKLGACRPCTPRRVFQRPTIPLVYVSQNKIKTERADGGVCFGKKIIFFHDFSSAWSTLTLNHFSFSDYGNFIHYILPVSSSPYDIVRHLPHREYACP